MSNTNLDMERLRRDLKDHFGTGAFSGMPAMMMEVVNVSGMTDEAVISKARSEGFDLSRYQK